MSFGFGGGGFGQSNNQSSGFGTGSGFGSSNTNTGGFGSGSGSTTTGFGGNSGNTTSAGGLFGNTSSSFGTGGGFGSNTQNQSGSLFGGQTQNRTGGFGTTNTNTGGSLFGSTSNTGNAGGFGSSTGGGFGSGTGGFGSSTPAANTNTGGGLFGANKPAGGFGSGTTTGGGFGSNTTGGAFGSSTNTGFGGSGTALAGGAVPPCDGTGSTPFNPFTEKDTTSSVMNHYQSISFLQPYQKYSFDELRLADYERGRRFGNGSNQAGAFGSSSFGGATGGTGFGSQQNTTGFGASSTPFGAANTSAPSAFGTTQTAGGFGSTNNSNPLFGGANKPANSMFGGAATTQSGSLFGGGTATAGTGGAFGSGTGTGGAFGANNNTGGGLFGGNQQQNKPAFGASSTGTTGFGGGGFGAQQNTTNSNPFGGSTTTPSTGFGQQAQTGTGGFGGGLGANQNQTQNKSLFGGGFGANNQQQQQNTGGGLFGGSQTQQPATGGGLFGGGNTQTQQPAGGSLFGGNQSQPAAGGGLFGGQNQQQQKPGGLFGGGTTGSTGGAFGGLGASQTQQPASGGLFGGQSQQQAKPGGLFGGSTGAAGGGGLFGQSNNTQQNAGSSLFGGQNQQQQPAGNSLFGGSQPAPQQSQPVPGSLTSSLLGGNPYGSQSIFSGLPTPAAPSPGPLATPLSSSTKQKQRAPLPYSITPGGASRLSTPPKRQGYGFSYSTYGSPSSSSSTPSGFSNSLLGGGGSGSLRGSIGGSFGRSFSKSYSTSNLRKTFDPESDSVLSPGALQSSSGRSNGGSMKRLTIDRTLRSDLFGRSASTSPAPALTNGDDSIQSDKLKKKVSFDATTPGVSGNEIVRVESTEAKSPEPTPQELGFLRSQRRSGSLNGVDAPANDRPEMESISRDLAVVPENGEPIPAGNSSVKRLAFVPGNDPKPGEYWMKPSRAEINKMSRDQLKQVMDFTVGRQHCGSVTFNGAVDLTTVDLENIFGNIVEISVRKITVYPDEAVKPPMGKGLNVVSTLRIENSWPRGRDRKSPLPITSGPLFDKHIDRLQKVFDTEFIDYEVETGTWVFKVPHFTTYGLDYDDEESENFEQSTLEAGPDDNRTPRAQSDHPASFEQSATFSIDESFVGSMAGIDDDTFDFKKRKLVPGSFGSHAMEMEDEDMGSEGETESFLEEGSTGSTTEQDDDVTESQRSGDSVVGSDEDQEMDMAGSFPNLHHTVEREDSQSTDGDLDTTHPIKQFGTPPKPRLDLSGDWAEQLQRTISPRKQNRDALREIQANAFAERARLNSQSPEEKSAGSPKKGFTNSIDLMNSLFQQPRKPNASPSKAPKTQSKGFEWPYNKQPKTFAGDETKMNQKDAAFHDSFKPRWGPQDSLVCAKNDMTEPISNIKTRWQERFSVFSEGRDVAVLKHHQTGESQEMLEVQKQQSTIQRVDGSPFVHLPKVDLRKFAFAPAKDEERLVWQLADILFNDEIEDDISAGVPPQLRAQFAHRIKKDRLTRLWESVIREKHTQTLDRIRSPEERAVHLLCSHRVEEACKALIDSKNLHLATLVAQIGRDATTQADLADQIAVWRQNNVLSEMTEPVRAIYELVAGNSLRSDGKTTGALEDRASTFLFTERFELDWFQAFGLRLWYGTTEDEPIETAVAQFLDDLASGQESAFPHPSHEAYHHAALQPGSDTLGRESPLWVLLKTYSAVKGDESISPITFPAAILPESLSGDRLKNRLSFQLHHVLAGAVGKTEAITIDQHQADRLIWDYASEILNSKQLASALFVLLHLSQAEDRKRAVQNTLARFGTSLPDPTIPDGTTPDPAWQQLTVELQIPEAWIWVAKALHARATSDAAREVDALIRGKLWDEAHKTFCKVVGPTAVISRDYATLEQLIAGFGDSPERQIRHWSNGGGVYEDFLRLTTSTRGRRDPTRLSRLVNALVSKTDRIREGPNAAILEERVAFKEMSRAVAGWIAHEDVQSVESSKILGLPLTADARVLQTVEMSRRYYGVVMAGGF